MLHRFASFEDAQVLGELNHQLIQDERHRNPMTVSELVNRMRLWLETDYRASPHPFPLFSRREAGSAFLPRP
jgi:hypothetical protein